MTTNQKHLDAAEAAPLQAEAGVPSAQPDHLHFDRTARAWWAHPDTGRLRSPETNDAATTPAMEAA